MVFFYMCTITMMSNWFNVQKGKLNKWLTWFERWKLIEIYDFRASTDFNDINYTTYRNATGYHVTSHCCCFPETRWSIYSPVKGVPGWGSAGLRVGCDDIGHHISLWQNTSHFKGINNVSVNKQINLLLISDRNNIIKRQI